ncbi:hypothetical protein AGR13a_Cc210137 [Agrobacterium genomosp. 13 str. CFBP 6927]|uniref:Uncharacterized protein n=1 Tax=Agrobacterium genomosp. 13 str. CFBP 6927 TaxID=1183428 RepID=A0ABM9VDE5_9HYPH|nr:hypothetical protein AGR13a_Cc210137 [Agrobacterium genomosp. 13 str. CFBP 6927]
MMAPPIIAPAIPAAMPPPPCPCPKWLRASAWLVVAIVVPAIVKATRPAETNLFILVHIVLLLRLPTRASYWSQCRRWNKTTPVEATGACPFHYIPVMFAESWGVGFGEVSIDSEPTRVGLYPPLPYRASPPPRGESARGATIASRARFKVGETLPQIDLPLEGEMPGRAEGGKAPRLSVRYGSATSRKL